MNQDVFQSIAKHVNNHAGWNISEEILLDLLNKNCPDATLLLQTNPKAYYQAWIKGMFSDNNYIFKGYDHLNLSEYLSVYEESLLKAHAHAILMSRKQDVKNVLKKIDIKDAMNKIFKKKSK